MFLKARPALCVFLKCKLGSYAYQMRVAAEDEVNFDSMTYGATMSCDYVMELILICHVTIV
jgi:hypothetical protein